MCLCLSLRFHTLHMLTSLVLPDIFLRTSRCVNLIVARNPHVNYILILSRASGFPLFQSSRAKELSEPPSYTKDTGLTSPMTQSTKVPSRTAKRSTSENKLCSTLETPTCLYPACPGCALFTRAPPSLPRAPQGSCLCLPVTGFVFFCNSP